MKSPVPEAPPNVFFPKPVSVTRPRTPASAIPALLVSTNPDRRFIPVPVPDLVLCPLAPQTATAPQTAKANTVSILANPDTPSPVTLALKTASPMTVPLIRCILNRQTAPMKPVQSAAAAEATNTG